jgi:hypothetical protein
MAEKALHVHREPSLSSDDPTTAHYDNEKHLYLLQLDWHLLPFVFILYSLSVLDRSNLGNARLAGLEERINLTGWRYNWLGTIFYIACGFFPSRLSM